MLTSEMQFIPGYPQQRVRCYHLMNNDGQTNMCSSFEQVPPVGTSFVCLALVSRTTGTSRNGPDQSGLPRIRTQVQALRTLRLPSWYHLCWTWVRILGRPLWSGPFRLVPVVRLTRAKQTNDVPTPPTSVPP